MLGQFLSLIGWKFSLGMSLFLEFVLGYMERGQSCNLCDSEHINWLKDYLEIFFLEQNHHGGK